jgi:hypothetical protein
MGLCGSKLCRKDRGEDQAQVRVVEIPNQLPSSLTQELDHRHIEGVRKRAPLGRGCDNTLFARKYPSLMSSFSIGSPGPSIRSGGEVASDAN